MFKSKLIVTLRTLSNNELRWFEAYIRSPFFNKNENVLKLFSLLKKYHPEYPDKKVRMEAVFPRLFPKEKIDEQKLRYVMSDLTRLLENYLAFVEFENSDIYKKHLLLNAYDRRALDKSFITTLEESYALQKKQPHRDVNYFFNQHLIEENAYLHSLSRKPRAISSSLQEAVDNLDLYYLSNRLRYSCAILNRQEFLQEKYNNLFLDEILAFLSKTNLENVPAVSIYHRMVMNYVEPANPEHFHKLKSLLESYHSYFPIDEVRDMYTHVLNYCMRKLHEGDESFAGELLKLYQMLLKKEFIFDENGFLSPSTFKNTVSIALRKGQLDWAEDFLKHYRDRIVPEFRESTYTYNLANILYYRHEYSKALKLLQNSQLDDIYYHLDGKVLLLKTYYELNESEPFFSLIDAFSNYLKRNKLISDGQRSIYLNFVKFTRKLFQLKSNQGRANKEELRKELKNTKAILNLQWLSEKLEEKRAV